MRVPLADWKCSKRERELVNKVLDSGWLTYGPYCKELERVWSEYHSCKYGVVNSSRPGHDLRYGLDGSKMKFLGWEPPKRFEDSLRKTVEWTLENPRWIK